MASPLYLTLLAGPVEAVPVPKPLVDALTSVQVQESATGGSGFQLTFTLANDSILQTLFLLAGGSPIPIFRVILVVTFGGLPQVIMDGIVEHHEVVPDAAQGSSKLVISGHDLSALMDSVDFSGLPYPGMPPEVRVETILGKYAAFGIVPEVIPALVPDVDVPMERYATHKKSDLAYIRHLAKEVGYVFYVIPGPLPGMNQAYWGPQVRVGIPQPCLNVNLDSWTNVESLTFQYSPRSSVLPVVWVQDATTNVPTPIPIPPVTPLNPPLGLGGADAADHRAPVGDGEILVCQGVHAGPGQSGGIGGCGDGRWDSRCCPLRANTARAQPGGRSRRGTGLRRNAFRGQHHAQPEGRRIQAEFRTEA